jgi:hypothetical protein
VDEIEMVQEGSGSPAPQGGGGPPRPHLNPIPSNLPNVTGDQRGSAVGNATARLEPRLITSAQTPAAATTTSTPGWGGAQAWVRQGDSERYERVVDGEIPDEPHLERPARITWAKEFVEDPKRPVLPDTLVVSTHGNPHELLVPGGRGSSDPKEIADFIRNSPSFENGYTQRIILAACSAGVEADGTASIARQLAMELGMPVTATLGLYYGPDWPFSEAILPESSCGTGGCDPHSFWKNRNAYIQWNKAPGNSGWVTFYPDGTAVQGEVPWW